MTKMMSELNIKTLDSKKCIFSEFSANRIKFFNYHDTHLTPAGMKKLFNCMINSNLITLFE